MSGAETVKNKIPNAPIWGFWYSNKISHFLWAVWIGREICYLPGLEVGLDLFQVPCMQSFLGRVGKPIVLRKTYFAYKFYGTVPFAQFCKPIPTGFCFVLTNNECSLLTKYVLTHKWNKDPIVRN